VEQCGVVVRMCVRAEEGGTDAGLYAEELRI